jgi:hypothetical protein
MTLVRKSVYHGRVTHSTKFYRNMGLRIFNLLNVVEVRVFGGDKFKPSMVLVKLNKLFVLSSGVATVLSRFLVAAESSVP